MVWKKYERQGANYIITSRGIVTAENIRFHTSEKAINSYAKGLLEIYSLENLITDAVKWVRSTSNLSLLLFLALAPFISTRWLILSTLLFFLLWYALRSVFVTPSLSWLMKVIDNDGVLILLSLIMFSYLGIFGYHATLASGLIFYLIFKLDLLRRLFDYIYRQINHSNISINDRIFKMLLVKYALKHNIATSDTEQLQESIMKLFRKENKK